MTDTQIATHEGIGAILYEMIEERGETLYGGEQQRVNLARGLAAEHPILLLDEPTASLDAESRDRAVALIRERRDAGAAILGIFHDAQLRGALADRVIDVSRFAAHTADT